MKPVKIIDIAREANVSPSTVARVVHNNGYVSHEKRIVVEAAIRKLGYVPNKVAQGLRNQRTNFIGHVLPLVSDNPVITQMGTGFHAAAEKEGYHVLTAVSRGSAENETALIYDLVGMMVEAIVFTTQTTCKSEVIEWVLSQGIPIVMIERSRPIPGINAVLLDNFEGAYVAVSHFISKGHTDIAYIGKKLAYTVEKQRYDGYLAALRDHGIDADERWVNFADEYSAQNGYQIMEAMYARGRLPTGIFAASDSFACGVLQSLYQHGISVPKDISLMGYDNALAGICAPPLTSIDLQTEQVGLSAVELIKEYRSDKKPNPKKLILSPRLVDRGSVQPPLNNR